MYVYLVRKRKWRLTGPNINIGRAYQVDVTSFNQVKATVDQVVKDFNGRLDIFVANAGSMPPAINLIDIPLSDFQNCVAANQDSVVFCAKAAGKHFRDQKRQQLKDFTYGKFIATASVSAGQITELPDVVVPYAMAKAGVVQLCNHNQSFV